MENPQKQRIRIILSILFVIGLCWAVWYFRTIVAYLAISAVIFLVARPLVDFLSRPLIRGRSLPRGLAALLTLFAIWMIILGFFSLFIPVVIAEARELSLMNSAELLERFSGPLDRLEDWIQSIASVLPEDFSLSGFILSSAGELFNPSLITGFFSSFTGFLGNFFVAFFSISFISFFFLKEEKLLLRSILLLVPDPHEEPVKNALRSSRNLLRRYFSGLLAEVLAVMVLVMSGMLIVGLGFREALLIGVFAGISNVIPYVGPLIGSLFGIFMGLASQLPSLGPEDLLLKIVFMALVFGLVQLADNIVFQPYIYSSSVHAHPLEIFLVILASGMAWGIPGMIAAVPSYTVLRVFIKEFLKTYYPGWF